MAPATRSRCPGHLPATADHLHLSESSVLPRRARLPGAHGLTRDPARWPAMWSISDAPRPSGGIPRSCSRVGASSLPVVKRTCSATIARRALRAVEPAGAIEVVQPPQHRGRPRDGEPRDRSRGDWGSDRTRLDHQSHEVRRGAVRRVELVFGKRRIGPEFEPTNPPPAWRLQAPAMATRPWTAPGWGSHGRRRRPSRGPPVAADHQPRIADGTGRPASASADHLSVSFPDLRSAFDRLPCDRLPCTPDAAVSPQAMVRLLGS